MAEINTSLVTTSTGLSIVVIGTPQEIVDTFNSNLNQGAQSSYKSRDDYSWSSYSTAYLVLSGYSPENTVLEKKLLVSVKDSISVEEYPIDIKGEMNKDD